MHFLKCFHLLLHTECDDDNGHLQALFWFMYQTSQISNFSYWFVFFSAKREGGLAVSLNLETSRDFENCINNFKHLSYDKTWSKRKRHWIYLGELQNDHWGLHCCCCWQQQNVVPSNFCFLLQWQSLAWDSSIKSRASFMFRGTCLHTELCRMSRNIYPSTKLEL